MQGTVALSSAEAELYAAVKAASEAKGIRSMMLDMGIQSDIVLYMDASAAIGMLMKQGLTGVRHIDTQYLWLQDEVKKGVVELKKVPGTDNPADAFTKRLPSTSFDKHLAAISFERKY